MLKPDMTGPRNLTTMDEIRDPNRIGESGVAVADVVTDEPQQQGNNSSMGSPSSEQSNLNNNDEENQNQGNEDVDESVNNDEDKITITAAYSLAETGQQNQYLNPSDCHPVPLGEGEDDDIELSTPTRSYYVVAKRFPNTAGMGSGEMNSVEHPEAGEASISDEDENEEMEVSFRKATKRVRISSGQTDDEAMDEDEDETEGENCGDPLGNVELEEDDNSNSANGTVPTRVGVQDSNNSNTPAAVDNGPSHPGKVLLGKGPPLVVPKIEGQSSRTPVAALSQFCIFCPASFKEDSAYAAHIVKCNPVLTWMINFSKRKCLVCNNVIRGFSVTGLLRHGISCIIKDRTNRLLDEKEVEEQKEKEIADAEKAESLEQEEQQQILGNIVQQRTTKTAAKSYAVHRPFPPPAPASHSGPSRHLSSTVHQDNQSLHRFSARQISILVGFFRKKKYATEEDRSVLTSTTGLTNLQIKQWFQRERCKHTQNGKVLNPSGFSSNQTSVKLKSTAKSTHPKGWVRPMQYPEYVTKILNAVFKDNMFPSPEDKLNLAKETKLTLLQVHQWFCNARRKIQRAARRNKPNINESKTRESDDVEEDSEEESEHSEENEVCENTDEDDLEEDEDQLFKNCSEHVTTTAESRKKCRLILKEAFQADPQPSILDVMRLSRKVGLPTTDISAWFAKQRRENSVIDSDTKVKKPPLLPVPLPSSVTSPNKRLGAHDNLEDPIQQDDTFVSATNVKLMTTRQKLTAIKKLTRKEIKDILCERKPVIVKILLLLTSSNIPLQTFANECLDLAEALEANNPFTVSQIQHFGEWEDDFCTGMYPENDGPAWKEEVDNFRVAILQVWSRILVFASFTQCSMEEAAMEILNLNMARNAKITNNVQWEMVHVFKQLEATVEEEENPDCDAW